ncbi:helix-turn-helix domain-containing protein [Agrobacterium fabrum]|uniref:helix-turn-helix domain-containing protein n=1 Tax=Rhizobium/Agrobacterium group TaxID=227290 RepID=UPI000DD095AC|nr:MULTISPECIES: helix-turn-helix transcriptional regulator [Rhizobium/Agrobacterium group]UXT39771.1 helix-turn-helix transcriptional regulator [Agrobacterium tumefaciens]MCZ7859753.1 helix-turn-helix transcriptional regulator [Agrobacterium salinitolerans]TKV75324.1 helix-turn-helix domain-containing protein [Rhizobium sp. AU243]WIE29840.1 helix-turn-helix transcriptional regulator [Agrobacterium fabrum]WIE45800.1 helix-turn-helix transcriptional regulator [Agrobacterium fabrum]
MDVRKTIGWNLRRLRVDKGLSQERLALEAGIDRSYVGRVERGMENVTVSTLEAISLTLNVHVSELFAVVDDKLASPKPLRAGRKPKAG